MQSRKVSVAVLKLNFGLPNLGERGPQWGGLSWCHMERE